MQQDLPINRATVDKILGHARPSSITTREVGLAAVAAELSLRIEDLELDAADAVERGAAALFLSGFSARPVAFPSRGRIIGKGGGRKTLRSASVRRSRSL